LPEVTGCQSQCHPGPPDHC